jgi:branched-subunit amino acid aminotransferase/4-amino-4-deoxychorismate lyase
MIWVGGRIVPDDALAVSALDRAFEHGLGLFETFRTWNGLPTLLDRHLARLKRSAAELGLPLDPATLPDAAAVAALIGAEQVEGDASLRITLTGGRSRTEGSILWMRATPLPPPIRPEGARVDPDACTVAGDDPLARHKSLNYWRKRLAYEQARARGFDEVFCRTAEGSLWEGSRTNVFLVESATLTTPALAGPIVPGVMRSLVLQHARGLPGVVQEDSTVATARLRSADEVFLTNSVRGIIPVARAGRWTWQAPGPRTQRLWASVSAWLERGGISP